MVRASVALRSGTTLRGREDWARHYCLSAALAVAGTPFASDSGGLIKEQLDALAKGSGFSFGDLMADRAGIRFTKAATDSEVAALRMQNNLQNGYSVDDYFPAVADPYRKISQWNNFVVITVGLVLNPIASSSTKLTRGWIVALHSRLHDSTKNGAFNSCLTIP